MSVGLLRLSLDQFGDPLPLLLGGEVAPVQVLADDERERGLLVASELHVAGLDAAPGARLVAMAALEDLALK
jgi:hypothetical protein